MRPHGLPPASQRNGVFLPRQQQSRERCWLKGADSSRKMCNTCNAVCDGQRLSPSPGMQRQGQKGELHGHRGIRLRLQGLVVKPLRQMQVLRLQQDQQGSFL